MSSRKLFFYDQPCQYDDYYAFCSNKRLTGVQECLIFFCSQADTQDASERMEEDQCSHEGEEAKKLLELHLTTSPGAAEAHTDATSSPDQSGVRTWWMTDVGRNSGHQTDHHAASASTRWDFSSILFPDLGSSERLSSCLASPDSSLLPGTLAVGDCDISPWRRRVNQREVKMSSKEREEDKHRRQWDVNRDREVCSSFYLTT